MARRYVRDAKGRFAPKGYSGQTGGRGARLKSGKGNTRKGGGAKMNAAAPGGTISKPRGLKPGTIKSKPKVSSARTRRPTAAESRAKGLTPISEIKARRNAEAKAAQAANASNYQRRYQSQRTKEAADAYRKAGGKRQKYSTIKNPAPEGSAPFSVTGSTYQGRRNAAAGRAARDAKLKRSSRVKTDQQVMQQADRVMTKLAKRQKNVVDNASSLESGLRGVRRNNARAARVNQALQSRGLLGKYTRRTAPADPIRMTPAGRGISRPKVSSARKQAANRLKIKTATKRKLKTNRESVIPSTPKGPKTMKARRIGSTVSKPRTKGNAPAQVASRVRRKNAANKAGLKQMGRYGNIPKPSTYNRAIKRANTLKRADVYLKTGKLPGKDNSIRAQRELKAAKQRLNAKNAARRADRAESNIPMRGSRARRLDASINRAVKEVKAAKMAQLMKPKAQVKAERAARAEARRAAALAKPKRVRSAESLRVSRAKRILKEREMKTSGTLRQWEQSKRTQERALAFYKSNKRRRR